MSRRNRRDRGRRLSELLREIVAEEIGRIEDDRLRWLTVTEVRADAELATAKVFVSSIDPNSVDEGLAALEEHRGRIQGAIGAQARLRRVPRLDFRVDDVVESASRIEGILREIADDDDGT